MLEMAYDGEWAWIGMDRIGNLGGDERELTKVCK
jgi:hypothetical protein